MTGRDDPRHEDAIARHDAVARRALEEHVLALVVGWGQVSDDLDRERGRVPNPAFQGAEIVGDPPDTSILIRMFDPVRRKPLEVYHSIWKDEDFQLSTGKVEDPEFIAAQLLMWARGG